MMDTPFLVRQARAADVGALAAILHDTFESTWLPQLTPAAAAAWHAEDRPAATAAQVSPQVVNVRPPWQRVGMLQGGRFRQMRDSFAAQFEAAGDDYLFRANLKSPGVRVTPSEREHFVSDFNRRTRTAFWVFGAALIVLMGGWVGVMVSVPGAPPIWPLFVVLAMVLASMAFLMRRLAGAPARALRGRPAAAPAFSAAEATRISLSRVTWPQLAGIAPLMAFAIWRASRGHVLEGWHKLWLVALAAVVILVSVQAFRKWRSERRPRPTSGGPGHRDP